MKKKIISALLCFVMAIVLLPRFTLADGNDFSASRVGNEIRTVSIGETETLEVDVVAWDMDGINYKWTGPHGVIEGEQSNSLTIQNFTKDDIGEYQCEVSNNFGGAGVISFSLIGENHLVLSIVGDDAVTVDLGDTVSLAVRTSADDMSGIEYSWYIEKYDEVLGLYPVLIEGANSDSLTLENITADKIGSYYCRASDDYGNSEWEYFTVSFDNHFSAAPVGNTEREVNLGENVTLAVSVTGDSLDGVMYYWSDPDNNIISTGASSLTLTNISQTDYGYYDCYVRDAYGNEARVSFNIYRENHFSASPAGETERKVSIGDTVTLAVDVSGDNTEHVSYAWYGRGVAIIGANESRLTLTDISTSEMGQYYCVVDDNYGNSDIIFFQVSMENHFSAVPAVDTEYTVNYGDTVTLSVEATATDISGITYSWRHSGKIEGATSSTYTVDVMTKDDLEGYWCDIYDGYGNEEHIFFMISMENHFTVVPVGETARTVAVGDSMTLAVEATADDTDDLWFIWSKQRPGTNEFWGIDNAETSTFSIEKVTEADAGTYECVVYDGYGNEESVVFVVTVSRPASEGSPYLPSANNTVPVSTVSTFSVITDLTGINRVSVDGKAVASRYYTIANGVVTLSEEFMATLSSGKHTITAENDTHVSTATFVVDNPAAQSPKTGDMGVMVYGLLSVLSTAGVVTIYKKKERK